ncbi:MAG: 4-alpha-glucanotransferase [Candidatus Cloacimonetes bacterium]|nr:4-alpha-glucanotransferase [Candidatus Cloacimonadota bacterium]MDD4666449.1 4-alpha-glucanotransferase [Candidatus Cloacimonadota bacterium]
MKRSGILLHISSLPGAYGIGDLGPSAYDFADFLQSKGYNLWQILPLNHCGYGNSPYNPISAFAFNRYLISPELLAAQGYLSKDELKESQLPNTDSLDFETVLKVKGRLLDLAASRMLSDVSIDQYIEANQWHLKPYLAYCVLSRLQNTPSWYNWSEGLRHYSEAMFDRLYAEHMPEMQQIAVQQMIFEDQLGKLKKKLLQNNISLIGDLPLYLSYESSEVWAHQEWFDLDEAGNRLSVAGVPPDAFSESGQLWGNPIYKWELIQESCFELFLRRFEIILKYFDLLRLDHFIGYVNYWKINCPNAKLPESAINGAWVRACPEAFFDAVLTRFSKEVFIAEDLGILNQDVCQVRDSIGFPGMIILQFCFEESVPDVPNFPPERFIYTGTHDNCTTRGWWNALPENSPSRLNMAIFCKRYLPDIGLPNEENIHLIMAEIARISGCQQYIIPMQDILGLDEDARMNIPGTALGNWQWRMTSPCSD